MDEELSSHPAGADLSPLALTGLLAVIVVPTLLALALILGVGR